MSFLAPLYMIAAGAVALPILFHLIRRTPRGRQLFSSLMFLAPSPPRLTRRSRLDQWLLLLLRASALILLALAFSRPFLREAASLAFDQVRARRVALVLDTSASMQRPGLWRQAVEQARLELDRIDPGDDVALFTYDSEVSAHVEFDRRQEWDQAAKLQVLRRTLSELSPSWGGSDLGAGLVQAADALRSLVDAERSDGLLQIVLISDLQKGVHLEALQAYEWPPEVTLAVRQVESTRAGNATLRRLTGEDEQGIDDEVRVRITSDALSEESQFFVRWETPSGDPGEETAVYVPPGQSHVVRLPRPPAMMAADRLVLRGDPCTFDNTFFTVPVQIDEIAVGYLGDDSKEDPDGLRYYLGRALVDTPRRQVEIIDYRPADKLAIDPQTCPLIVVTAKVSDAQAAALSRYRDAGGNLLLVAAQTESAVQLVRFTETARLANQQPQHRPGEYAMLGEVDFGHPLFEPFAKPQYNDFTKIHFWNHVRLEVDDTGGARVLARFDDGYPALWEQAGDRGGTLWLLAAGWNPDSSELALSSKFVPLLNGMLDQATGRGDPIRDFAVGDTVPVPEAFQSGAHLLTPAAARTPLTDATAFGQTSEPGVYRFVKGESERAFAVNVPVRESDTAPIDPQQLEQFGVPLGEKPTRAEQIERERQLRDIELEGRQKLWRWCLLAAMALLVGETWLAGRQAKRVDSSPRE